jgi:oligopeptide transport system substrate-binding protein
MKRKFSSFMICMLLVTVAFTNYTGSYAKASSGVLNSTVNVKTQLAGIKLAVDQTLRIKIGDEPTSLDPAMFQDSQAETIAQCVYEPLFRSAKNVKGYEPGIATSYKLSKDKMTYTFYLRKNAKFDNGTLITAEDVVYTVIRTLDPKTGAQRAFDYYEIKNAEAYNKGKLVASKVGIKAIDKYTVQMTLRRPLDYWIGITCRASFGIISKASCVKNGKLYGTEAEKFLASGPFKMESWNHESTITLVKNPNYWDAKNVTLNKMEIKIVKDNTTASGLYKTGALDYLEIASDTYKEYKDSAEFNSIPAA